eukprot:TRINITY_DN17487_c0_g1_i1.p1 TRINITY_DN17487_c0_g1~~TRINITY_DN17487_c0_g1_i1.p1  ORF type:complete len:454 (-),score=72.00 TRINITY_DN17487_c0_g1_i1:103-1464(-)
MADVATETTQRIEIDRNLQNLRQKLQSNEISQSEYRRRKSSLLDKVPAQNSISRSSIKSNTPPAALVASAKRNSENYSNSVPRANLIVSPSHQMIQQILSKNSVPGNGSVHKIQTENANVPTAPSEIIFDPSFPNYSTIPTERGRRSDYNVTTGKWKTTDILFKMATEPFARGSMRFAFHMQICDGTGKPIDGKFVAKMSIKYHEKISGDKGCMAWLANDPQSIDQLDDREDCFQDVRLQMYAKQWANQFNHCDPPKKVDFLPAYCLDLMERPGCPTSCVEPYIEGTYKKHNNNYGYVSDDHRNTPQAFSHFTYHYSSHTILICDIQGVGDVYTDPLMHSTLNEEFGRGNLGSEGMEKFLSTHCCNAICEYLQLPSVNAQFVPDIGTTPGLRSGPFPRRPSPLYPPPDLTATANATSLIFRSVSPPVPGSPSSDPNDDAFKAPPLYTCGCSVM